MTIHGIFLLTRIRFYLHLSIKFYALKSGDHLKHSEIEKIRHIFIQRYPIGTNDSDYGPINLIIKIQTSSAVLKLKEVFPKFSVEFQSCLR